ncbi:bifunctional nuclease family protein [Hyalangium gracile]|uniref:bifunctional nuclease family protein n=1 Tax=Hyalangium gracile TaxID=394092 RepID=UPI001CCA3238|nr:bifunctional nuclease family protein [Hyalangium gracile]
MKTPNRASLFLAPISAVVLALVGLLFLPAFSAQPAHAAPPPLTGAEPCITEEGGDPAACKELVELVVRDVVPLEEAQTHAVVLSTEDGQIVLPVFVDEAAAVAIAFRLAHMEPPQPLAQDLLDDVVVKLGAHVTEVRIDDLRGDIYTGRVFLQQGKKRLELDARPADSIAMALDGKARIRVTRKVLSQAGINRDDIDSLHGDQGPGVGGSGPVEPELEPVPMGHPPIKSKEISL